MKNSGWLVVDEKYLANNSGWIIVDSILVKHNSCGPPCRADRLPCAVLSLSSTSTTRALPRSWKTHGWWWFSEFHGLWMYGNKFTGDFWNYRNFYFCWNRRFLELAAAISMVPTAVWLLGLVQVETLLGLVLLNVGLV